jgi:acylphosphatase
MKASKKNTYNYKMENNMADIVRKHIIFHGSVQGVGFRYYSEHKANQLRLTGWVKNLYNGDVEMEVQGSEAAIDELVAFLAGRRFVQITGMDVRKLDVVEEERSFGID